MLIWMIRVLEQLAFLLPTSNLYAKELGKF